jgi:hypothetical protein
MRFDAQTSFPYPVLRAPVDDYLDGAWQPNIQFVKTADDDNIKVLARFELSIPEIQAAIDADQARYVVVLTCRDTYFRKVFQAKSAKMTITVASGDLRGEVEALPLIIAIKDIPAFRSRFINPEFGSGPFAFKAGELLAIDEPLKQYIDREYFRPIGSVIQLATREGLREWDWDISLDDLSGKIIVYVSEQAKAAIDLARNNVRSRAALLNSLWFTTVMVALGALKESEPEHADKKWAKVFKAKCAHKGLKYKTEEPFRVAQELLECPLLQLNEYVFKGE